MGSDDCDPPPSLQDVEDAVKPILPYAVPVTRQRRSLRAFFASVLPTILIVVLVIVALNIGWAWLIAAEYDAVPGKWDNMVGGNHGPWRQIKEARMRLELAIFGLFIACAISFLSWLVKPNNVRISMVLLTVALTFVFMATHLWLID